MSNDERITKLKSPTARYQSGLRHSSFRFLLSLVIRHLSLVCRVSLGLGLILASSGGATEPIHLAPYPQKFRTFYNLSDAAIPLALRSGAIPLPIGGTSVLTRAADGAIWLGTTQGLMRVDFAA